MRSAPGGYGADGVAERLTAAATAVPMRVNVASSWGSSWRWPRRRCASRSG
ncbi:hypothetical protein JD76_01379 [Micromonospora endolithica]|nr:hypothetical protein JD76_01379 [Micromonospora endolithica]